MNRSRMFLLAAVAFVVAIGVAAFTYQVLSNRMKPIDDTTPIVVAALPVQVREPAEGRALFSRVSRYQIRAL